MDLGRRFY